MSKDEQALDWFVSRYPGRFSDPKYLHDERIYKWDAHLLFVELLGDAQLDKLLGAGEISTIVERILKIVRAVHHKKMLSPYEMMALKDGLKDVAAATRYAESISGLLGAKDTNAELFQQDRGDSVGTPGRKRKGPRVHMANSHAPPVPRCP